jgi:putative transposase
MPGTYSQILYHIVFSTKHREPWITADVAKDLYPILGGYIRAAKGTMYQIGGVEDHVHLYLRWRTDETVAELMRDIKSNSTKWIHASYPALGAFAWQEGYSVFSVCKSREPAIKRYIENQAEHHERLDFKTEPLWLFREHEIEFDERYVFD